MRKATTVLAGVLLVSACVQLPDILKTAPVRSASFAVVRVFPLIS